MAKKQKVRAAAVQIAPDLTSGAATLDRVIAAIDEAAGKGAEFIVFPETFVPWYPYFSFVTPPVQSGAEHIRLYEHAIAAPGPETDRVAAARAQARRGRRARDQRARPRHALQHAARVRRRRRAQAEAAQDHADLPRADDLGPGRRLGPHGGRHRRRTRRRACLLGALQPARPLRADGAARGDPRRAVPGLAGRPDLRRADRGDDPPSRARERLLRRQFHRLAHRSADRLDHAERSPAEGPARRMHDRDHLARGSPPRPAADRRRGHSRRRPRSCPHRQAQADDGFRRPLRAPRTHQRHSSISARPVLCICRPSLRFIPEGDGHEPSDRTPDQRVAELWRSAG